tara:strand:- start:3189 stop:3650 length:462 start_codon:yes stop_codon:yes gene_type:complete
MKINVDRMARLAGLSKNSSRSSRSLNEGMGHDHDVSMDEMYDEVPMDEMYEEDPVDEMDHDSSMDELIEVDERELVQELRRAKKMMMESKRRTSKKDLQEAQLKSIIEEEVQNVFSEMNLNLNSDWIYGSNKPKRSKQGYSHQGSFLKGLGFK